eukprot:m.80884 g.80884  ORF g.80884 m.80884 type:complete len:683 (+) comp14226_c0_seq1:104-2152(+)
MRTFAIFSQDGLVSQGGLEALDSNLQGQKDVVLVPVMGSISIGKTWLWSYLAGSERLFKTTLGMDSTMRGGIATTFPLTYMAARFEGRAKKAKKVVLVDLEGKRHDSDSDDFELLLPTLLCAKSIVYLARQGRSARNEFLQEMEGWIKLASSLELGEEASALQGPFFGDLHVVVNSAADDQGEAQQMLAGWLQVEKVDGCKPTKENEAIHRRNQICHAITKTFTAVCWHVLPPASQDGSWLSQDQGRFSEEYKLAVHHFGRQLVESLKEPRQIGKLEVNASRLVPLLSQISRMAFDRRSVNIHTMAELLDKEIVRKARDATELSFTRTVTSYTENIESKLETKESELRLDLQVIEQDLASLAAKAKTKLKKKLEFAKMETSTSADVLSSFQQHLEQQKQHVLALLETLFVNAVLKDAQEEMTEKLMHNKAEVLVQLANAGHLTEAENGLAQLKEIVADAKQQLQVKLSAHNVKEDVLAESMRRFEDLGTSVMTSCNVEVHQAVMTTARQAQWQDAKWRRMEAELQRHQEQQHIEDQPTMGFLNGVAPNASSFSDWTPPPTPQKDTGLQWNPFNLNPLDVGRQVIFPEFASPASSPRQNAEYYHGREVRHGPRGGEYYINRTGNKTYLQPSQKCDVVSYPSTTFHSSYSTHSSSANQRQIYTGPRGGSYYINSNGNKTYVKKR